MYQKNINADLQCLPIFLAACNLLLVISGSTYTSRLWCCVELFVYVNMHMEDDSREVPIIITIGADDDERAHVRNSWMNFDVATCECAKEQDKRRMLAVIERHAEGVQGFNVHVNVLAANILGVTLGSMVLMLTSVSSFGSAPSASVVSGRGGLPSSPTSSWSVLIDGEFPPTDALVHATGFPFRSTSRVSSQEAFSNVIPGSIPSNGHQTDQHRNAINLGCVVHPLESPRAKATSITVHSRSISAIEESRHNKQIATASAGLVSRSFLLDGFERAVSPL